MNEALDPEQVAAFLAASPGFLAERPALYARLAPPRRVHGEALADHMAAMLDSARARARVAEGECATVMETARAAQTLFARVADAVLALLRAENRSDCVAAEFPAILGVDAAALACEGFRPQWRALPPGAIRRMMGNRPVLLRTRPHDALLLHAEAALLAERDILVRIPGDEPALLALLSRDPAHPPAGVGDSAWVFLGEALGLLLSPRR